MKIFSRLRSLFKRYRDVEAPRLGFWQRREMTNAEKVQRMHRAKAVLEDDLFVEAFAKLNTKYYDTWMRTDPTQQDLRERMYLSQICLQGVMGHFVDIIGDGQVAQDTINRQTKGQ